MKYKPLKILEQTAEFLLTCDEYTAENLPHTQQLAIKIREIMTDGDWHNAEEIGAATSRNRNHIRLVVRTLRSGGWEVETNTYRGYRLVGNSLKKAKKAQKSKIKKN